MSNDPNQPLPDDEPVDPNETPDERQRRERERQQQRPS
jgi:hypothetical protein